MSGNRSLRVLFAFGNLASFRLQMLLAARLAARGWAVSFLFWGERGDAAVPEMETEASRVGQFHCLADYSGEDVGPVQRLKKPYPWRSLRIRLATRGRQYQRLRLFAGEHLKVMARSLAALLDVKPDCVIISEDGVSSEFRFVSVAARLGIRIVTVPYGYNMRADIEHDLGRKQADGSLVMAEGRAGALLRRLAPHWIKTGRFAGAVMFPSDYILAAEMVGVTVPDPWIVHGGLADILCVEGEIALERYRKQRVPEAKLRLTGSPYCDEMHDSIASDPAASEGYRAARPIEDGVLRILVSWFPSYHDDYREKSEYPTYEEMSLELLRFLFGLKSAKVTLSLHPAVSGTHRDLLMSAGIPVTDEYVIGLIPKNDLFVTYFSSTIRWALAAGKPVVNYDAYKLHIDSFDSPGFVTTDSAAHFKETLTELVENPDSYRSLAAQAIAAAPGWGLMDGRCTDRIIAEIERLAA
jgi:hypothetical protein